LGFPNQNTTYPGGFHLDPATGDLSFRPTQINQVAVIVIEVSEWRMVNGTMQVIGKTRRDMQVIVISCPTSVTQPTISSPISYEVCAGDSLSIPFMTLDTKATDSTYISAIVSMPGANFIQNNGQTLNAMGTLHWRTDSTMIRTKPYTFVIRVWDNGCPFSVEYVRTVNIFVRDSTQIASFYAGPDRTVTNEDSILIIGLDSLNIGQQAYWKSLGDGYFSDTSAALSTYYFGPNDRVNCEVELLRIPITQSSCGSTAPDTMLVRRWFGAVVASYDTLNSDADTAYLKGTSLADTNFFSWWLSHGDGLFSDTLDMHSSYTFGSQDSLNCGAWLYLKSNGPSSCSVNTDSQFVSILPIDSFEMHYNLSSPNADTIFLDVSTLSAGPIHWTSTGNGTWSVDSVNNKAWYIPDFGEKAAGTTTLTATRIGFCARDSASLTIQFLPNGIYLPNKAHLFNAYPNPVKNSLTIEWEVTSSFVESRLLDIQGKVLIRGSVKSMDSSLTIDMSSIAAGTYFIQMIDKEGTLSVLKVVKE